MQKKLTLDTLQLQTAVKMFDAAVSYYNNAVKLPNNVVDLCTDQLRSVALTGIYQQLHKAQYKINNSPFKIYRVELEFSATEALTILGSVIPPNNSKHADMLKQVFIDYCIAVLKATGVFPNYPTYTPSGQLAANAPAPFINKSTTMEDYYK